MSVTVVKGLPPFLGAPAKQQFVKPLTNITVYTDIDKCTSSPCDPSAICRNAIGSYECYCGTGFTPIPGSSGIATTCKDVDECTSSPCDPSAICRNVIGSFECYCGTGFIPIPGSSGNATTCKVQPLNCSNPEKATNSTLVQCGGKHSQILEQPNSVGNEYRFAMESARQLLEKVCQNFSVTDTIQTITNFTNDVFSTNSQLKNMTTSQRLNVAATILDLLENMAMAVALTLPSGGTKSISEDSFAGKIQVFGNQSMPGDLARIEIWNNTMEINWRTVMGAKNTDFAAVSFFVFSDMESILNNMIRKDGVKQLEATEGTGWLNSKVVTARISNKAASHDLTEMVNFTLKLNQDTKDHKKAECVYLKITEGGSFWSSEGCFPISSNGSYVICQCNHLTSFAILMSPIEIKEDWSLLLISTVGLTVSLLCLAASIVVFTKCRSIQKATIIVYKHLSINLFLAQLIFLTGIHVTNKVVCALVAGCLHYFFLTVFAWMFLDALQVFIVCRHLTVTKFAHTYVIRRRYLYPSGYAVSALIVIVSAAIRPYGYGSEKNCWLSLEWGFRWSRMAAIQAFLCSEFNEENIDFSLVCEDYKNTKTSSKLMVKAQKIDDEFVKIQAPKEAVAAQGASLAHKTAAKVVLQGEGSPPNPSPMVVLVTSWMMYCCTKTGLFCQMPFFSSNDDCNGWTYLLIACWP
ncbi:hypothetical protein chiPu_0015941 [Chiloscyllium punctatum]|uniref:Uncharacterized protein n=1 Tax=Chiloscyllium punctatum TaxID=137246 RepID=A0A401T497_CHIPU|nr:hypothetical protein [Chiloscyllium punctatum]